MTAGQGPGVFPGDGPDRQDVDYRLDEFVLDPTNRTVRNLDIAGAVIDSTLTLSIEQAPTLELTLEDTDLALLRGDLLTGWTWGTNADDRDESKWILDGRDIDAKLDDMDLRLVKVSKQATQIVLTFEELAVVLLRSHKGARKAFRDQVTRAEFVKMLCDAAGVPLYCPALHEQQPIAKAKLSKTDRRKLGKKGLDGAAKLKIKGVAADSAQLENIQTALDEADKLNAPELAALAMLCAGIGESGFRSIPNAGGSNYTGVFQGSKDIFKASDTEKEAHWFLKGGKGFQQGGAIHLARANPSMSPGEIATRVEAGGEPASFYGTYLDEAKKILRAYTPGAGHWKGTTVVTEQRYAFARGKSETSWDAIQRLADEVGWRAFVRKGVLWYISEEDLFKAQPQMHLVEGTRGVDQIDFDLDLGAKNLVSEMTATARAGLWTALPGMVTTVDKLGPVDGRWLVTQIERPLTKVDPATVTLKKPLPEKAEPAPDTSLETLGTDVGPASGKQTGAKPGIPVLKLTSVGPLHETSGLAGFPAHDYFAPAGSPCVSPVDGVVYKISGSDPANGPPSGPHGPFGWSVYIRGEGHEYYLTHMGTRTVKVGSRVKQGQQIGTVGNYAKWGGANHIHMGVHG